MRALVQRVHRARVSVGDEVSGQVGRGLCVFVGVTHADTPRDAARLADKVAHLRVFPEPPPDDDPEAAPRGMERSVLDVAGEVLVVSQFTLYGDTSRGRRPSWVAAARPEQAEPLVDHVVSHLRAIGLEVATGRFRADMDVELVNDGPVTLSLEVPPGR